MGMRSYVIDCDITVRRGGLRKLKKLLEKKRKDGNYYDAVKVASNGEVSLEGLDGCKIIGYWYEEFCRFLKDISRFIEGLISFEYEGRDGGPAVIYFHDVNGKPSVTIEMAGPMTQYSIDDLMRMKGA